MCNVWTPEKRVKSPSGSSVALASKALMTCAQYSYQAPPGPNLRSKPTRFGAHKEKLNPAMGIGIPCTPYGKVAVYVIITLTVSTSKWFTSVNLVKNTNYYMQFVCNVVLVCMNAHFLDQSTMETIP